MKTPKLVHSHLTGRVYVATKYKEFGDGHLQISEKHDITESFYGLAEEMGFKKADESNK